MPRKKLIAANWKMYKTPEQTSAFFQEFLPLVAGHNRDEIVVCPPYIDLHTAVAAVKGSNVFVGAQNMHWEKEGAFTGEISAPMSMRSGSPTSSLATPSVASISMRRTTRSIANSNMRWKAALLQSFASAKYWKNVKPDLPKTCCAASACGRSTGSRRKKRRR